MNRLPCIKEAGRKINIGIIGSIRLSKIYSMNYCELSHNAPLERLSILNVANRKSLVTNQTAVCKPPQFQDVL